MRKIDLEAPTTGAWQRWIADCVKATTEICSCVAQGERPVVSSLYKRRSIKDSFFFSKGPPFYGKCAYLLIHPASGRPDDDPALHLTVDTRTGLMGHRTERGRACIDIFALNLRDQLVVDRRRACREAWRLLSDLVKPGGDREAAQELAEIQAGKRSFTMAQRAVIEEAKANFGPVLNFSLASRSSPKLTFAVQPHEA